MRIITWHVPAAAIRPMVISAGVVACRQMALMLSKRNATAPAKQTICATSNPVRSESTAFEETSFQAFMMNSAWCTWGTAWSVMPASYHSRERHSVDLLPKLTYDTRPAQRINDQIDPYRTPATICSEYRSASRMTNRSRTGRRASVSSPAPPVQLTA